MESPALVILHAAWPILHKGLDIGSWKVGTPAEAQAILIEELAALDQALSRSQVTSGDRDLTKFALCAFFDERILSSSHYGLDWFSFSLVMKHFQDFAAGEHFYVRLEQARQEKSPCLPLMLFCLKSGYKGKYQFASEEEWLQLVDAVRIECEPMLAQESSHELMLAEAPGKLPREKNGKALLVVAWVLGVSALSSYFILMFLAQS